MQRLYRRGILVLLSLLGCVDTASTTCGEHLCAAGRVCAQLVTVDRLVCIDPAQATACEGLAAGMPCDFGACHDGVCLPISCGNALVDPGESCDDGNTVTGDGCSADCKSDETCGNGVTDGIAGEQCDDGNLLGHDGCTSRCVDEDPTWTELGTTLVGVRRFAAMTYDAAHGELVLFGGNDPGTTVMSDETWVHDGLAWSKRETPVHPSARVNSAMVYDAARKRVVLFGGATVLGQVADTWEWDGERWEPIVVDQSPPPRHSHGMAYDVRRKRIVMFGGAFTELSNVEPKSDTWAYDGQTWAEINPPMPMPGNSVPPPRATMGMAYDPTRDRIVVFGGAGEGRVYDDTWEHDGTRWHELVPDTQPSERYGLSLAFEPNCDCVLMFGGGTPGVGLGVDDAMWRWDGMAWTEETGVPTRPPPQAWGQLVTDLEHQRVHLFAGQSSDDHLWSFNGTVWSAQTNEGINAKAPSIALDARRGRMVLVGAGKTYERARAGWVARDVVTPMTDRYGLVWDSWRNVLVLFGGMLSDTTTLDQTWEWNGEVDTWTERVVSPHPPARVEPSTTFDQARGRMVLFGGSTSTHAGNPLGDTWEWDGTAWSQLQPATAPSARTRAAMAYDPIRKRTVLFGGNTSTSANVVLSNETWLWDGVTWTRAAPMTVPPARAAASMAWDATRGRLVMFGGLREGGIVAETWEWDGASWERVPAPQAIPPRRDAAIATDPEGGVVVYGGRTGVASASDMWRLRWEGEGVSEVCRETVDADGDGLEGCVDLDCWGTCAPLCPPGTACSTPAPWQDGVCAPLETCRSSADCPCTATCGDGFCDPGETCAADC